MIAHLGAPSRGMFGGSEFHTQKTGEVGGASASIDLDKEARLRRCELARAHVLRSAHDISDGGFAVALAESCIAGVRGCRVKLPGDAALPLASRLFSEEPTRVIVSFAKEQLNEVRAICARHEVPFESIGEVGGETVSIESCLDVSVTELAEAHHRCLEAIVGS